MYLRVQPNPYATLPLNPNAMSLAHALETVQRTMDRSKYPNYMGAFGEHSNNTQFGVRQPISQGLPFTQVYRGPIAYTPARDAPRQAISEDNPAEELIPFAPAYEWLTPEMCRRTKLYGNNY